MGAIYKNGIAYSPHLTVDNSLSDTSLNPVENRVVNDALEHKVDKEDGKGLSTEDFTTEYKNKLDGIAVEANKYILPTASSTLGGVKTTSTVNSATGYTACPIISGVPYYQDTNTTYTDFVGSGTNAKNGLVPKPPTTAGTTKYLREDGTWQVPPDTNTVYTHPTTAGNKHIPSGGSSGKILGWDSAGTAKWINQPTIDSSLSTTSTNAVQNNVINTALNGKSNTGHNHDGRYYTESEIDTKLNGKANTHTHPYLSDTGDTCNGALTIVYNGAGGLRVHRTDDNIPSISFKNNDMENGMILGYSTANSCFRYYDGAPLPSGTNGTTILDASNYSNFRSTGTTSDRNLKKDFAEFDERYENFYKDLKPLTYKFIDGTSGRIHSGFVSQDVEESLISNGLTAMDFAGFCKDVEKGESGEDVEKYTLRYPEFIALNTHMIQKLLKENEELKSRLEAIEAKLGM